MDTRNMAKKRGYGLGHDTTRRRRSGGSGAGAEALEGRTLLSASFVPVAWAAGGGPASVAVGDFNGDGRQDLAVANSTSDNVSVLLGNGSGGFLAAPAVRAGDVPFSVVVGDFNGDGRQDLAVANFSSNNVSVLLGDGSGGFNAAPDVPVGAAPISVAVADFNGDGRQDLAVANRLGGIVSVLLGDGSGGFNAAPAVRAGDGPSSVAVADFNGDGRQDLAVTNRFSDTVSVLLGNGSGGFGAAPDVHVASGPVSLAVGDFNGDGRQDLAVAHADDPFIVVEVGNGSGAFREGFYLSRLGASWHSVAVGDFDGDGRQDVAAANAADGTVSVVLQPMNTPSFPPEVPVGNIPNCVVVGDFNGDGRQDLAVANFDSDNVTVALNTGTYAVLTVEVYVRGSSWKGTDGDDANTTFKEYLAGHALGDAEFGYRVDNLPAGTILPWTNVDQVVLRYSAPPTGSGVPAAGGVTFDGVRSDYSVTSVGQFDPRTFLLTLDRPLGTQPDGGSDGDRVRMAVPRGAAGALFELRLNALPGDVNRSGAVVATDFSEVKARFFRSTNSPVTAANNYTPFHDLDGGGSILATDFSEVKKRFFDSLPAASPVSVAGVPTLGSRRVRPDLRPPRAPVLA